jgi:hypothetical protein
MTTSQSRTHQRPTARRIDDRYADLLALLPPDRRQAIVIRLAHGYYEGWTPSRAQMADLVGVELGVITVSEGITRERQRTRGQRVVDITALVLRAGHSHRM